MEQASNPFEKKINKTKVLELSSIWGFRAITYLILLCAGYIFLDIIWKGGGVVFQLEPPFVNVPFLTERPETLHVFEYEGEEYQLGNRKYQEFIRSHDDNQFKDHHTYNYSAGGIGPTIVGTVLLVVGAIVVALFLGVMSAIYLSEYSKKSAFIEMVRLSIINLAGVPSIVFGLFGYAMFVIYGPMIVSAEELDPGRLVAIPLYFNDAYLSLQGWNVSLLAGCFTLALMVLPIVITASEECLRAVPQGFREASLALGATQWQSIRTNVLPYATPGILTSSILGLTRAAGETAPIMFTAAYVVRDTLPWETERDLSDLGFFEQIGPRLYEFFFQGVMALPYHIYVLAAKIPKSEYTQDAQYGTVFVFMVIVLLIAMTSILLRARIRQKLKW